MSIARSARKPFPWRVYGRLILILKAHGFALGAMKRTWKPLALALFQEHSQSWHRKRFAQLNGNSM